MASVGRVRALQAAEKLNVEGVVKGHDFSRVDKANQIDRALAAEGKRLAKLTHSLWIQTDPFPGFLPLSAPAKLE
jgi:hypothetical protein